MPQVRKVETWNRQAPFNYKDWPQVLQPQVLVLSAWIWPRPISKGHPSSCPPTRSAQYSDEGKCNERAQKSPQLSDGALEQVPVLTTAEFIPTLLQQPHVWKCRKCTSLPRSAQWKPMQHSTHDFLAKAKIKYLLPLILHFISESKAEGKNWGKMCQTVHAYERAAGTAFWTSVLKANLLEVCL